MDKSGGRITYQPAPTHPCTPPTASLYPIGTRWTCDTCWDFWEVRADASGKYWHRGLPYPGEIPRRTRYDLIALAFLLTGIVAGIALILTI